MLPTLVAILTAWLVGGGAFLGIGLLLLPAEIGVLDAFWLGLAATVALGQLWHLWLPIEPTFAVVVITVGWIGLAVRCPWNTLARKARANRLAVVAGLIGMTWLALMGLRPLEIYDAGLYHLQAVAWTEAYPTVPGLGNLHGRLAFYSSFFLLLSAFAQGPLIDESYRVVVGLLVFVFLLQVGVAAARVVRQRQTLEWIPASDWLLTLMALPTLSAIGANGIATTSTDLPLFPLQVLLTYYVIRWLETRSSGRGAIPFVLALVLAALTATLKLSALPYSVGCVALMLLLLLLRTRARGLEPKTPLLVGGITIGALITGMLVNGVVLSGYPFYPSTAFAMPVDWRVPAAQAAFDAAGIQLFGRQPATQTAVTLQGWDWLPAWIAFYWPDVLAPILGSVVALAAVVLTWVTHRKSPGPVALLLLPLSVAIVLWFLTAPAPRFVGPLIWLFGAVAVAVICARGFELPARLAALAFVLVSVLPPQAGPLSVVVRAPVAAVRRGLSSVPVEPMTPFVTDSGLALLVPESSNQTWAAPIPSTPTPNRALRLRCAADLACGFVLDLDDPD